VTLDLSDCVFAGPALPDPFVRFELATQLARLGLLASENAKDIEQGWNGFQRQLRLVGANSGAQRVCNQIIAPLAERLGFAPPTRAERVATREGLEDGGWLMCAACGIRLRAWSSGADTDLDAPHSAGRAYRFSPTRCAQRVLLAMGEHLGLLTDGHELRLLLCDPARSDSHIAISLDQNSGWRGRNFIPDSYRLLLAIATPSGIAALPRLLEAARLGQARVTRDLRSQARHAIEGFLQAVLDNPANSPTREPHRCAEALWTEALILIYRLLFILKLESAADPARAFSFASTNLWRTALSPNKALGPLVRRVLDHGHDTGRMLEDGLRLLFRVFRDGLSCNELSIAPLGGALFGELATPLLNQLAWGERAVALLLDRLLWTTPKGRSRERVLYGALDVEELGRVYEALLELEPGIATEPMLRLRRGKLEVVVPASSHCRARQRQDAGDRGTRAIWVEDIPSGRFYLRTGIGRKSTGSYYTPNEFVRFLVRETLAPQLARRSPDADPNPAAILALKVADPAMGSGHFLVETCRYLGDALYAACRMCDELAIDAEVAAERNPQNRVGLLARATALRRRVADLPDPDGLLLAYLPSRASEAGGGGVSQSRALAICRRLVAVHCLYGVDSNALAVELAKLSLWLESYAEGLPLTFLDHRLVHGDSIAGAFFASLTTLPVGGGLLDPLWARDVGSRLAAALAEVRALQASVGANAADLVFKAAAKTRLDAALWPLRLLARTWCGAVMLGLREADDEWLALARNISESGTWPQVITRNQDEMLNTAALALPWDLMFPEVFHRDECGTASGGFDAVLSNPPWDMMQPNTAEFLAGFDLSILDASNREQARTIRDRLLADPAMARRWRDYHRIFEYRNRLVERLYRYQRFGADGAVMGGKLDLYRVFAERIVGLLGPSGAVGMVVPAAFHANEGSTGIRLLYLQQTRLEECLSFENRRKLFDIHCSFKFAVVVARRPGPTQSIRCGFYLTDYDQLRKSEERVEYPRELIDRSGGAHATLLEFRKRSDLELAAQMFLARQRFHQWTNALGIALSREMHMSDDASKFTALAELAELKGTENLYRNGYLVLHEGKTIHQFTDHRDADPQYAISLDRLGSKHQTLEAARYFRAACREIARATDERTSIATILPPGVVCGHTISVERRPSRRPNAAALTFVAVMNSFSFDWLLRQKASVHVSIYILSELPVPELSPDADRFLAHGCLRLSCNHRGFAGLWSEQLGDAWKEPIPRYSWPAIPSATDRWDLRAMMDAVVAHAYGLDRARYQHVLSGFSHKSYPSAPELCLAAFDDLTARGLAAFCRKRDPYRDIPLAKAIAQPAIELPTAARRQRSLLQATAIRGGLRSV
jgi:hypothetical protein